MLCNLIYSGLVAGKLIFDPLNFIRFVLVSSSDKELTISLSFTEIICNSKPADLIILTY